MMRRGKIDWLAAGATLFAALSVVGPLGAAPAKTQAAKAPAPRPQPGAQQHEDQKILHALSRLGFGPRPGEVERVRQIGLNRWIESQLAPGTIDDAAVEAKLSRLSTLRLPPSQLMLAYEADTANFLKRILQNRGQKGAFKRGMAGDPQPVQLTAAEKQELEPQQARLYEEIEQSGLPPGLSIQGVGELEVDKLTRAVESNRQLQEVLVDFWGNHFNVDVKKGAVRTLKITDDRAVIRPHIFGKFRDLLGASAKSPAMLFYLDNVRSSREFGPPNRRQGRRKARRAEMAQDAAMTAPGQMAAMPEEVAPARKRGGINENYARELMELHTLGVEGGYTQQDVQEVARCFTGWSIDRANGAFQFKANWHDNGPKTVLGQTIPAGGGLQDGERVLDILASSPATARFMARKLCLRLVSDEPPAALIEKTAQTFLNSGGDLRAVVKGIVTAPEFFAASTYRAKIKSPFEFAVSAVRALNGQIDVPDAAQPLGRLRLLADANAALNRGGGRYNKGRRPGLSQQIATIGQPLFAYQAPTGYSEDSRTWISAGALIARLNFALALTGREVPGVVATTSTLVAGVSGDDHDGTLNRLVTRLLGGDISPSTRATLVKQMPVNTPPDPEKLAALILGSPEFQRR